MVTEVPRSLLNEYFLMNESQQDAIYFLIGGDDETTDQRVYIGQTSGLKDRLKSHNSNPNKDFWQRALILTTRTNSLTSTHTLFLEHLCLQKIREAGRYSDENANNGIKPYTPPPLEADCYEIFESGSTLLATLGFPLFSPLVSTQSNDSEELIYYCKVASANGRGVYTPDGFVVFKGSIARLESVPSFKGSSEERMRNKLLESGVLEKQGEIAVFTKDHIFRTPSGAAGVITGSSVSGWTRWKTTDGRTLDQIERIDIDQSSNLIEP